MKSWTISGWCWRKLRRDPGFWHSHGRNPRVKRVRSPRHQPMHGRGSSHPRILQGRVVEVGTNHQEPEVETIAVARCHPETREASQRVETTIDGGPPHLQRCFNHGRVFHMGQLKWWHHTHKIGPRQAMDHTMRTGRSHSCRLCQENVGGAQITTDPTTMSGDNANLGKSSSRSVTPG